MKNVKKLSALILSFVLAVMCALPVSAETTYSAFVSASAVDCHSNGSFSASIDIYELYEVAKLKITVSYNEKILSAPVCTIPDYYLPEYIHEKGKLIIDISSGSDFYENEKFHIDFGEVIPGNYDEEDFGFSVEMQAEFETGVSVQLPVECRITAYMDLPVMPLYYDGELDFDKMFVYSGENVDHRVSFTVNDVDKVEYLKVNINCNKDVFKYAYHADSDSDECVFSMETTDSGYVMTYRANNASNHNCSTEYYFSIAGMENPDVSITAEVKCKDSAEARYAYVSTYTPANKVYLEEELPKIVPSEKIAPFVEDDILYLYDPIKRLALNNEFTSTVDGIDAWVNNYYSDYENRFVPTGSSVITMLDHVTTDTLTVCVLGDINRDGNITAGDARLALRIAAQVEEVDSIQRKATDVDRDGKCVAYDARQILRVSANIDAFAGPHNTTH